MKKHVILLTTFLLSAFFAFSKEKGETMIVQFQSTAYGQTDTLRHKVMTISKNIAWIRTVGETPYENAPEEQIYLDFNNRVWYQTAVISGSERITAKSDMKSEINWEINDSTYTIQGFLCKKGRLVVNSNEIEIWFTEETPFSGTLQPRYGIPTGVVLKVSINGNRIEEATKVTFEKNAVDLLPKDWGKFIDRKYYGKMLNEIGVISINIFDDEMIEFNPDLKKPENFNNNIVYHVGNGAVILKKVKLPESAKNYDVFAELIHHAEKDAYDRTGTVFLIPTDKKRTFLEALLHGLDTLPEVVVTENGQKASGIVATPDYNPPLELMRFFTSFGVHGYGHIDYGDYQWDDSVVFKQEITQFSQYLEREAWIGIFIGNWTKNAHRVSLSLKYYPEGKGGQTKVIPLFFNLNVKEMEWETMPALFLNDKFSFSFQLPENVENAKLNYLSTGHGGWDAGDEFNPKVNEIFIDNNLIIKYIPWREDCASFRLRNPASGNFRNGLSSSDLSRSGWCPGTITNSVYVPTPKLLQGTHTLKIAIPQGAPEGNSNSHWTISGALVY